MYESFYALKEKPFKILPDPDYLYMSQEHENTYTHLEYAVRENKGFVVITGEIGSGKTTLINFLLGKIQQDIDVGLINNTYVPPMQFIKMICQEFELNVDGMDKAEMLDLFHGFLLQKFGQRRRVVLIIDEAQNLTPKMMEEIRMLSNLEDEKHHLIQIVLVGQPELKRKLKSKNLVQFAQRVTVHCHLNALSTDEIEEYIKYRLKVAGAQSLDIFDESAIEAVSKYSRGIPRLINIICDTALVYGYADDLRIIGKDVIENVIREREAGGIFCEAEQEIEGLITSPHRDAAVNRPIQSQLRNLEKRVDFLDRMVQDLSDKLKDLTEIRKDRDDVVIELFKMLKKSMEARLNMLLQFKFPKDELKNAQKKTFQDYYDEGSLSRYSLLKKRRRK